MKTLMQLREKSSAGSLWRIWIHSRRRDEENRRLSSWSDKEIK